MTGTHGVQRQLELMLAEAVIRKDDMTESANTARRLGASAQDMLGITYGEGICSGEVGVLCVLLNKCSDAYNGQAFDSKWARTVLTSGQKADDSSWS